MIKPFSTFFPILQNFSNFKYTPYKKSTPRDMNIHLATKEKVKFS